jgi:phospholipase/lecithinase/hemolysin
MKHIKIILALFFSCVTLTTFAATTPAFDQIVFFGDSLSDAGLLYAKDLGLLPKSPPYFKGRFSNGPVWSERLAAAFLKDDIVSQNFAVGGETANFYNPPSSLIPYDLTLSFYEYISRNILADKTHSLIVVWIGGNDYIGRKVTDAEKFTTDTVNSIQTTLENMIAHGGKYFLIVNLPDLGKTPYARNSGITDSMTQLTKLHNAKLQTAVDTLQKNNPAVEIKLFDMFALFEDLENNTDAYNKKYETHISNLTDACWTGGNTLAANDADLEQTLAREFSRNNLPKMNFTTMANAIRTNPALSTAYQVGQRYAAGAVPCADPASYVFWDSIHPTTTIHTIVSLMVADFINVNFN